MKIGIVNQNKQENNFPKLVKQSPQVASGMYKAVFNRFVTFGFAPDPYNEGKFKFNTHYGFELIEDMAGVPVPKHVQVYDDESIREGAKTVSREYALMDEMHHKSNGFMIAKALNPQVPVIERGKDKEHKYIVDFDWEAHLGKSVLIQVEKTVKPDAEDDPTTGEKKAFTKIVGIMPLGLPLEQTIDNVFFNLYDAGHQEVWDSKLYRWEKNRILDRTTIAGEPNVVYIAEADTPAPQQAVKENTTTSVPADFDDDIPFAPIGLPYPNVFLHSI